MTEEDKELWEAEEKRREQKHEGRRKKGKKIEYPPPPHEELFEVTEETEGYDVLADEQDEGYE